MTAKTIDATDTDESTDGAAPVDMERLQAFAQQVGGDTAAAAGIAMVELGDRLGLYRAMIGAGPMTAEALSDATGCNERLLLEWLRTQAAAGYVIYHPDTESFELELEAAIVLATDDSPAFMTGAIEVVRSIFLDGERLADAFRTDGALSWGDHHECMYHGFDRFLSHSYDQFLVDSWVAQVDGLADRLAAGGRVLDVGCGTGSALVTMAEAFPNATFVGIDAYAPSVETARSRAQAHGVADRVRFEVGRSTDYDPGGQFDAIFFFEALHDMGDPEGAIRHADSLLVDDGVIVAVEINAADSRAAQFSDPMARLHFAASTALCTPGAISQTGPSALGNQVGLARWSEIFAANGFSSVVEIGRTPVVLVFEVRR